MEPVTVMVVLVPMDTVPVPRPRGLLPTKVKSPFQSCGLLLASVRAAPEVLFSEDAAASESEPVPKASGEFRFRVPALSETPPVKVFVPASVRTPAVVFVIPAVPEINPMF